MNLLVTGGAGFLGSHLCEKLLSNGHNVIALDNLQTGSIDNIVDQLNHPNFKFIAGDTTNDLNFEVDGIFNFACPASPEQYQKNPVQTIKTNVLGSINVLELANKIGAIVLQASTSEVYGDPLESPQNEKYWGNVNTIGPRSCYDEGKRISETLFNDYSKQFNVDIRIARIFNTYGPRMAVNDGRVVSNFIVQALKGEPITVFGDGQQIRSFCYVSDLVEGIVKLFEKRCHHEPINIGNPSPISMLELASEIIDLTDSKSKIVFKKLPIDDPKIRIPDIANAKFHLDWEPTVDRKIGLNKTIEYFKKVIPNE